MDHYPCKCKNLTNKLIQCVTKKKRTDMIPLSVLDHFHQRPIPVTSWCDFPKSSVILQCSPLLGCLESTSCQRHDT